VGAMLWHQPGPWHEDPAEALLAVQVQVLREEYDLPTLLREHLDSARESVRITEADDPYDLLDHYREELRCLEALFSRPVPTEPREQIEFVRAILAWGGEGVGNILDVTHVSDVGGLAVARQLPTDEIRRLCGLDRPTLREAIDAVEKIHGELGRGDCVCFPFYADAGASGPVGWYFVGNTFD
jgi:hypothetical protein